MLIAIWPLLIALIGLLMWVLADGKLSEVGKILFFCGALVTTYALVGHTVKVG